MVVVLDLIYLGAALLGWPWLVYRRLVRGPGSLALRERLGDVPRRPVAAHCIWIHAVSLGEVNAARTLMAELRRRLPAAVIVISSTTQTGLARARELFGRLIVFRFPLDLSFIVRRVLERIRPSIIVLMELETWPNLLELAWRRGIPVIIANGRVTEQRSMRRYRHPLLRPLARRMFARLTWVAAQDETYARRFVELGVPEHRVEVCGSLKYDAAEIADWVAGQEELAREMGIDRRRPLWVCGSTGPGEEEIILRVYRDLLTVRPDVQLAIVPRKPERFDQVAGLIVRHGFACLRRSGAPPAVPPDVTEPLPVFLGDTVGELRKFYALASVVFVGRTLAPMGGSDVMEVAGLGKPMIVGPHTDNFAESTALLIDAGAARRVRDAQGLTAELKDLLGDDALRQRMGRAGQEAIRSRRGATERTVSRIIELLG